MQTKVKVMEENLNGLGFQDWRLGEDEECIVVAGKTSIEVQMQWYCNDYITVTASISIQLDDAGKIFKIIEKRLYMVKVIDYIV